MQMCTFIYASSFQAKETHDKRIGKNRGARICYTELLCNVVNFIVPEQLAFPPLCVMLVTGGMGCAAVCTSTIILVLLKPSRIVGAIYMLLCQLPKGNIATLELSSLPGWEFTPTLFQL